MRCYSSKLTIHSRFSSTLKEKQYFVCIHFKIKKIIESWIKEAFIDAQMNCSSFLFLSVFVLNVFFSKYKGRNVSTMYQL